jgi:hypothetical protein
MSAEVVVLNGNKSEVVMLERLSVSVRGKALQAQFHISSQMEEALASIKAVPGTSLPALRWTTLVLARYPIYARSMSILKRQTRLSKMGLHRTLNALVEQGIIVKTPGKTPRTVDYRVVARQRKTKDDKGNVVVGDVIPDWILECTDARYAYAIKKEGLDIGMLSSPVQCLTYAMIDRWSARPGNWGTYCHETMGRLAELVGTARPSMSNIVNKMLRGPIRRFKPRTSSSETYFLVSEHAFIQLCCQVLGDSFKAWEEFIEVIKELDDEDQSLAVDLKLEESIQVNSIMKLKNIEYDSDKTIYFGNATEGTRTQEL